MEKLEAIIAKIDPTSTGTSQRWIVGLPNGVVSGALYLPKNMKIPCKITIGFLNPGPRKKAWEVDDEQREVEE